MSTAITKPDRNCAVASEQAGPDRGTYRQILKSTSIIGVASVINILLGIVRTKFMAVLLGPTGVGLMGAYNTITATATSLAGLGIPNSGVRQIADAAGTGDRQSVARTAYTLRRIAWLLGGVGAFALLLCSGLVSRLTFGSPEHALALAILSGTVLFGVVSSAQSALVQGMRRVGDLARINILGAAFGTALSIPIVYSFGHRGIVPFLFVLALAGVGTSWWYARKIQLPKVRMRWAEFTGPSKALLKLGLAFAATGLMGTVVVYLTRIIIIRRLGIEAAGFYQSAWALSGLYVGFILQAMGADFYPRLTASASDNSACNRLVNEQTEVTLLLAIPGILATMTLAPVVIPLFYSAKFVPAVAVLQWQVMGVLLRAASWPMGFILLAKGLSRWFVCTELAANLAYLAFTWMGVSVFGLEGAGMAFLGLYLFNCLMIALVTARVSGFRWSAANIRLASVAVPSVLAGFLLPRHLERPWAIGLGLTMTLAAGLFSLRLLGQRIGWSSLIAKLPFLRLPPR